MSTGILVNGLDLATIFGAKGSHTAATTGIEVNGTDLNQILMALADGVQLSNPIGIETAGVDLYSIFGAPSGVLPIQGVQLVSTNTVTSLLTSNESTLTFTCNSTTWSAAASGTSSGTNTLESIPSGGPFSGSVPSGATSVSFSYSAGGGTGAPSVVNGASSFTALTGSPSIAFTNSRTGGTGSPSGVSYDWSLTISFQNSAGTVISTTTTQIQANCQA